MLRKIGAASSYLIVDLLQVVVQIRLVGGRNSRALVSIAEG
jgi:hypothetical protein